MLRPRGMIRSSLWAIFVNVVILTSRASAQATTAATTPINATTPITTLHSSSWSISTSLPETEPPLPASEPTASPEPEPTPWTEPEPTASAEPEPTASPEPEPTASPEPEPTPWTEPEPTSWTEPESEPYTGHSESPPPTFPGTTHVQTTSTSSAPCPSNLLLTATTFRQPIYSPNYPRRYDNYHNCSWHIVAPTNTSLRMSISGYEIESHSSCGYDALHIYNGQNIFGQHVITICGRGSFSLENHQLTNAFVRFHTDYSVTDFGFQLDYWAGPLDSQGTNPQDDNPCDGASLMLQATSEEQFLLSPGYPMYYSNDRDCSWTITFPEGNYLRIGVEDFHVESHYSCRYDYLDIYNVDSSNNLENVATLCGVRSSGTYSIENEAYLHFHTDYSVVRRGFKLSYYYTSVAPEAQPCDGGLLTLQASDEEQLIFSQNYPSYYPNYANCSWLIQASPDHQVKLTLEDFRLEYHYYCYFDALEIFDGSHRGATRLAKLCGLQRGGVYGSSSSSMYINFHSDYSVRYSGFKLSYKQVEEFHPACHGQELPLQAYRYKKSFVSPGYLDFYPNDLECEWLITAYSSAEYVLIGIENLHVQDSPNCTSDALVLYDGDNQYYSQLARLCGNISPDSQEFLSNSSSAFVRFYTDSSESDVGFNITYRSVDETYIACHRGPLHVRVSRYSNASIASPGYPSYYSGIADCVWHVESTLDVLQITTASIGFGSEISSLSDCSGDALEIYDGIDDTFPLLVKTCGGDSRPTYTSSSKSVFIRYRSAANDGSSRFRLTFKGFERSYLGCLGEPHTVKARSYPQYLTSPNYPSAYPNDASCKWFIESPTPYLKLSLDRYNIEYHSSCGYDALEIYEGPNSWSTQIAYLCGNRHSERTYIISSNITYVYFHSDEVYGSRGFNLSYQALEDYYPACVGEELRLPATDELNSFESPRYPLAYPNNMYCSWYIESTEYYGTVSLYVDDIDLGNNCSQDRLEFYDGYGLYETLCAQNSSLASVYRSTGRWMRVRFYSDDSITHRGFKVSYKRDYIPGCHGTAAWLYANDSQQILESPYYPSNYSNNAYCSWIIYSETGATLLYIEDFSLEFDDYCYNDYLRIRESFYGRTLARACGNGSHYLHTPIASHNYYTSLTFRSNSWNTNKGFRLSYRGADPEWIACNLDGPLRVKAQSYWTNLTSPNYPNAYPTGSNCSWLIETDYDDYVVIIVHFLNLPESSSCADSFLDIFQGANETSTRVARLCGNHTSDSLEYFSYTRKAFIRFSSDESFIGGGFQLSYKQASFADLACYDNQASLQASQEIQSISLYLYTSLSNSDGCNWMISSQTGYVRAIVSSFSVYSYYGEDPCSNGYLEVYDGADETSPALERICPSSSSFEHIFTSTSNHLYFHFNQTTAYRSIYLYMIFNTVEERFPACVGPPLQLQATTSDMSFETPLYPGNTLCRWEITSEQNYVYMTIEDAELDCGYPNYGDDNMYIIDGRISSSYYYDHLVDVCYYEPSTPIWSVSNLTSIVFRAGAGTSSRHFKLMYRSTTESFHDACSVSSQTLYAEPYKQFLMSPGYPSSYFNNLNCQWTIYSRANTAVRIDFQDLRLQPGSNCSDYLEIYDGSYYYSYFNRHTRYCGGSSYDQTYFSSSSSVFISFHSDSQDTSNGFNVTYESVDESQIACQHPPRHLIANYDESYITSPNYPDTYPNNSDCAWLVQVPSGRILLSVVNLHIDDSTDCSNEALDIFDGDDQTAVPLVTLCGEQSSLRYVSSSTEMYIQFHSDDTRNNIETGFSLIYHWVPQDHRACFGPPLEVSVNSTPSSLYFWGNHFANESVNCGWHLKSNDGFIRVLVVMMELVYTPGCLYESFEIFDGANNTFPRLLRQCGYINNHQLTSYRSTANELFLQLDYYSYSYFQLFYVNVQPHQGCQGQVAILHADSDAKTLESPGYSDAYYNNADCSWEIRADNGTIDLYFVDLRLEGSVGCVNDYLEIFDGPNENATSLYRLCSNNTMFRGYQVSSSSNVLFLRFQTDSSITFPGFFLIYGKSGMYFPYYIFN